MLQTRERARSGERASGDLSDAAVERKTPIECIESLYRIQIECQLRERK